MKNNNSITSPEPKVKAGEGGAIQFPNVNDVLSGRGGRINNHEGNVQFRALVAKVKVKYLSRRTKKLDKAWIAADIVEQIRNLDPPGRFLKEDTNSGLWYEVGDERARRKTGQALREDAPEIKEEMMEIDEEYQRSNLAQITMSQFPQMPYPPMYYPIAAPVYYPQVYPPAYQVVMPQAPTVQPAAVPFPPVMAPYAYPPVMYSPVPLPPPLPVQPQASLPHQTQQQSSRQSQTQQQSRNISNKDDLPPNKISKTNSTRVELQQQPKVKKERLMNSPPTLKLHVVHSNNSSQTDITVNSSAISENTEEMDTECYENIQLSSVKIPEERAKNKYSTSKKSKRSQWRNQLTQKNSTSNHFIQQNQHTIDDLPSIITTSNDNMEDIDQINCKRHQNTFNDRRSSSSLPEPLDFTSSSTTNISSESDHELNKSKEISLNGNILASSSSNCRKSLSLTDIDVIETLATMSRR